MNENKYQAINTILLSVLLFVVLAFSVYSIVNDIVDKKQIDDSLAARQSVVSRIHLAYIDQQDLQKEYEKQAYDNPSIERISEQQLLATEYQMRMMENLSAQLDSLANLIMSISN